MTHAQIEAATARAMATLRRPDSRPYRTSTPAPLDVPTPAVRTARNASQFIVGHATPIPFEVCDAAALGASRPPNTAAVDQLINNARRDGAVISERLALKIREASRVIGVDAAREILDTHVRVAQTPAHRFDKFGPRIWGSSTDPVMQAFGRKIRWIQRQEANGRQFSDAAQAFDAARSAGVR